MDTLSNRDWIMRQSREYLADSLCSCQKSLLRQSREIDRLRAELEQERTESSEWERLAHKYQDERNQAEARVRELEDAAYGMAERMDRARHILTKGKPTPNCNWGMLDTTPFQKALANSEKE